MTSLPSISGSKRVIEPDPAEGPDAKRPKAIQNSLKVKCLKLIIKSFEEILEYITKLASDDNTTPVKDKQAFLRNISLANNITKIIYATHELCRRQELHTSKMSSDFKFTLYGRQIVVKQDHVIVIWDAQVKSFGLSYSENNGWLGVIKPILHDFIGFSMRMTELRDGFKHFVLKQTDTSVTVTPISRHGLSDKDHQILLEGISFRPNIRRHMIRCLGPMTAFLSMLLSSDLDRENYENVVRMTMPHIPCIEDIIKITRNLNTSNLNAVNNIHVIEISYFIAEILLRNPVPEKSAMFFPLNFLVVAAAEHNNKGSLDSFLDAFSCTGSGGFYMYKTLLELQATHKFSINSSMNKEMASQLCFHCIFGTFKQDFAVLSSITLKKNWVTRKQIGTSFNSKGSLNCDVEIDLIPFKVYPKPGPTETPVLLVTPNREYVRSEYTCMPCFSGRRIQNFYIPGFNNSQPIIVQIRNILEDTLEKLKDCLKNKPRLVTTSWRDWGSLALGTNGDDVSDFLVSYNGVTFIREC